MEKFSIESSENDFISSEKSTLFELKNQIKNVMIPLLIKIFELKVAAQQSSMPPSRLHKKPEETAEQLYEKIQKLQNDLKLMHLWVLSCQKQIDKALEDLNPKTHTFKKEEEKIDTSSSLSLNKWLEK